MFRIFQNVPQMKTLQKILFGVNINTPVCRWGKRNGKRVVHAEYAQNNAHFDGPTTIGLNLRSAWACSEYMPQVVCAVHISTPRRFGVDLSILKCVSGFIRTSCTSWIPVTSGVNKSVSQDLWKLLSLSGFHVAAHQFPSSHDKIHIVALGKRAGLLK